MGRKIMERMIKKGQGWYYDKVVGSAINISSKNKFRNAILKPGKYFQICLFSLEILWNEFGQIHCKLKRQGDTNLKN